MNKKQMTLAAILLFAGYAVYGLVIFPLNEIFTTNVVLASSIWSDIIYQLRVWLEPLLLAMQLGFLIYGVFRCGARNLRSLYLLCGGALLFGYMARLISYSLVYGSLDLTMNYFSAVFAMLIELGICVLVVCFAEHRISRQKERSREMAAAAATLGVEADCESFFPFTRVFSWKNALLASAALGTGVQEIFRLLNLIVGELNAITLGTLPFLPLHILLDILIPTVLCYFLTVGILRLLCRKK